MVGPGGIAVNNRKALPCLEWRHTGQQTDKQGEWFMVLINIELVQGWK